ncbi:MAG: alpha-galactosidase [Candidatus Omnitrophica bacterium]|nr:alpha-galactosidase [Candidatus Omnitrophota bacterium]
MHQSFSDAPAIQEEPYFLTPPPASSPNINTPSVYGCRPGRPFLYRIPCTGDRPIFFTAANLPDSLQLDAAGGVIHGEAPAERGEYSIKIAARNKSGEDQKSLKIVVGDDLALTPPMGWNHWYTYYHNVQDQLFRDAAVIMIESGMADFGYQYVNIDDCWMVKPGSNDPALGGEPLDGMGAIKPNKNFPDMAAMCDFIHSLGLKTGIYTSPGPRTCAGYQGSYQHEWMDAQRFAQWGFDFLKYDWCSYGNIAKDDSLQERQKPYRVMGEILKNLNRDIILNLCQYGMSEVWKWGGEVGGHCWRTTGDLGLEAGDRLPGFYHIGFSNAEHAGYARPGRWNDPDYILIGMVGNARSIQDPPRPTPLTPSEQYSYMSMWCLMAAPLFYSGDITHLDEFTLNVLCNAEVIEVDQDPLGIQGRMIRKTDDEFIMAKPMHDGSLAVGLFNISETERTIQAVWDQLELKGPHRVRNLWTQEDLGVFDQHYAADVRRRGVQLIRLWPK